MKKYLLFFLIPASLYCQTVVEQLDAFTLSMEKMTRILRRSCKGPHCPRRRGHGPRKDRGRRKRVALAKTQQTPIVAQAQEVKPSHTEQALDLWLQRYILEAPAKPSHPSRTVAWRQKMREFTDLRKEAIKRTWQQVAQARPAEFALSKDQFRFTRSDEAFKRFVDETWSVGLEVKKELQSAAAA